MALRLGSSYIGTESLQTTTQANEEIIPSKPEGWTHGYNCYRFSFVNDQSCRILINNSEKPILLRAGQGFTCDYMDAPIYSFKVVEIGTSYNFIGAI